MSTKEPERFVYYYFLAKRDEEARTIGTLVAEYSLRRQVEGFWRKYTVTVSKVLTPHPTYMTKNGVIRETVASPWALIDGATGRSPLMVQGQGFPADAFDSAAAEAVEPLTRVLLISEAAEHFARVESAVLQEWATLKGVGTWGQALNSVCVSHMGELQ